MATHRPKCTKGEPASPWMRRIASLAARYYLRKPELEELIWIKHPSLRDLGPALWNEAAYRLGTERSGRLTALNVELTNRCNLACLHCPRSGAKRRRDEDMTFETFRSIIDRTPGLRILLPYQWGESLLSPILDDCVAYAAGRGIRVMLTTNGLLLDEQASTRLLEAGLTRLTVSFDGGRASHERLRGVDPERVIANAVRFRALRDRLGSPCALDASMVVDEDTAPFREEFRSIFDSVADRIQFIPRFEDGARRVPCRELWRGVLVVLANGDVTACCADCAGDLVLGNVKDASPPALFNEARMRALRRAHAAGAFPTPCARCAEYAAEGVSPRFS